MALRVDELVGEPEFTRVNAPTLPVQAYYAMFSSLRVWTAVQGSPCDTHENTQKTFATKLSKGIPGPWGATLVGDPHSVAKCTIFLDQSEVPMPSVNPIKKGYDPFEYLAAALRMARRWQLERKSEKWKQSNRKKNGQRYKHLPRGKWSELCRNERPTTLLDFLYGLRRRANYLHVDEFSSTADDRYFDSFQTGLVHVVDRGLLLAEGRIATRVGWPAFEAVAVAWAKRVERSSGEWGGRSVRARLEALSAARG